MIDADWAEVVSVEMDKSHIAELERRAEPMGLLAEEYCGAVLAKWLKSGEELASADDL